MAKEFIMPEGAKRAERTRTNWGNGGSSLLTVGEEYAFPTSMSKHDFVDHDSWVSIVLGDSVELALSTVCRARVGTPINGGQATRYACDGPATDVIKEVSRSSGDLDALLLALQQHGTGIKPTAVREYIITYQNVPQLKRAYTLEFYGAPLAQATPPVHTTGSPV